MYNEDVLDLYPRVPTGTRVTVTWQRFKTGDGDFAQVDAEQRANAVADRRARYERRAYRRYSRSGRTQRAELN